MLIEQNKQTKDSPTPNSLPFVFLILYLSLGWRFRTLTGYHFHCWEETLLFGILTFFSGSSQSSSSCLRRVPSVAFIRSRCNLTLIPSVSGLWLSFPVCFAAGLNSSLAYQRGIFSYSKGVKMLHAPEFGTLTLIRLGYYGGWKDWGGGGGGGHDGPPWDLGHGPRENFHNGSVRCNLQDCIFRFSKIFLFYFILINYANLCKKSDFLL